MKEDRYSEQDFVEFLKELIKGNQIEDKKKGIAKRMIDKGYKSLIWKQKFVFDNMIEKNSVEKCKFCGCEIPWCEMQFALDNGGYCSGCYRNLEEERED